MPDHSEAQITRPSIAFRRIVSQGLAHHAQLETPGAVVTWLGAVQAQDYAGAKWSLGLRVPGAADRDIEAALRAGTVLRTWALRGTLHFVASADIHWLLTLIAPRVIAGCARRYRELELDAATFVRTNDLLTKALADGVPRNRTALMTILEREGVSTVGQRAPYILQRASLDRLICQAETVKNDPFYRLLEAPAQASFDPAEGRIELARRYFRSRGPATPADFGWWSGLSMGEVKHTIAALRSELVEEIIGDQVYWQHRDTPQANNIPSALLLPGFDEYLLSYRNRAAQIDVAYWRAQTPKNGMLPATLAYKGLILGTWRRTLHRRTVEVAFEPITPLDADQQRAFEAAATRYSAFLGLPLAPA